MDSCPDQATNLLCDLGSVNCLTSSLVLKFPIYEMAVVEFLSFLNKKHWCNSPTNFVIDTSFFFLKSIHFFFLIQVKGVLYTPNINGNPESLAIIRRSVSKQLCSIISQYLFLILEKSHPVFWSFLKRDFHTRTIKYYLGKIH